VKWETEVFLHFFLCDFCFWWTVSQDFIDFEPSQCRANACHCQVSQKVKALSEEQNVRSVWEMGEDLHDL
jgi:hypothetical protein